MEGGIATRPYSMVVSPSQTQQPQLTPTARGHCIGSNLQGHGPLDQTPIVQVPAEAQGQSGTVENEKLSIYRHPLFPLLAMLFEKCEVATNSVDIVNSQAFDQDIKATIVQQAKEGKPFFTEDAEVDGLMLKSLQVLRIHLLELEKVNELCKDFCSRYIACLKGKLNSENLMRTLNVQSASPPPEDFDMGPTTMIPAQVQHHQTVFQSSSATVTPFANPQRPINVVTPQTPTQIITRELAPAASQANPVTPTNLPTPDTPSSPSDMLGSPEREKKKSSKRGILPKLATNVMKTWLFQHLVHPYPTEDEKRQLAAQTNLTILQVNNWFINARRRILQPMLDGNNPYSVNKNKKLKPQKIPAQRDWPGAIGVYAPYQGEQIQYHAPPGYTVVSPTLAPQAPMIVNVANPSGQQPIAIVTQPVQFIHLSGNPTFVQTVPSSIVQVTPSNHVTPSTSIVQNVQVETPKGPETSLEIGITQPSSSAVTGGQP